MNNQAAPAIFALPCAKKPEKISPRIAARRANVSIWTIYRLLNAGRIQGEQPSKRKILIDGDSLAAHLEATKDPAYWETPLALSH